MSYRIEIDPAACSAHGDCTAIAPEVFAREETAVVIGDGPDELILEAAAACPALAISVLDTDSGTTVFP